MMDAFSFNMTELAFFRENKREPDFSNMLKIMKREKPDRPVLFELFLNEGLYSRLAGANLNDAENDTEYYSITWVST